MSYPSLRFLKSHAPYWKMVKPRAPSLPDCPYVTPAVITKTHRVCSSLDLYLNNIISPLASGADPGFSLGGGGGGAKQIMCPHEHYERGTELTFGRGSWARLRKLWGCFNALMSYLSLIFFKHSDKSI